MTERQKKWGWGVGGGVFVLWFLLQLSAVFFHVGDGMMRGVSYLVFPPAWVHGSPVSYHRVVETVHAFVALQVASTYQEAFPKALAFVVRDARVKDLLDGADVPVQDALFTESDTAALAHAGISSYEQEKYLEEPFFRMRAAHALRDKALPSQEMRLQNVLDKIDLDMPFADIARYFSEDSSAINGGDLGVFLVSDLPAWAQGAATMQVDEVRADFVGTDAFWVLKVVDAGGKDDTAWIHLRGIAINKPTLADVLRIHAEEHPAWVFVW